MDGPDNITGQQSNTGSWIGEQDGGIVRPEVVTTKGAIGSGDAVDFQPVDECQPRGRPSSHSHGVPDTASDACVLDASGEHESQRSNFHSFGYQQKSGIPLFPVLEGSQQPTVPDLARVRSTNSGARDKSRKIAVLDGKTTFAPCHRLADFRRAKGCKAKEKRDVTRYRKPAVFSMFLLFLISTLGLANIWNLRREVRRLEERIQKHELLDGQDHTGTQKETGNERPANTILHDELSEPLNLRDVSASDVIQLSRGIRQADDRVASDGKSQSKERAKGKKKRKKRGKGKNLQVEVYVGSWMSEFNPKRGQCGKRPDLPGRPVSCLSQSFVYVHAGTILAFFQKDDQWRPPVKKKKKKVTDLLELNSKGRYLVRTAGTFMLHLNITLNDKSHRKSIGIFLNGQVLFACPQGGVRCSQTNERDSSNFRLCTAHGVTKLQVNDLVDIRTMDKDTTVKVKLQSQFWAVLLARH